MVLLERGILLEKTATKLKYCMVGMLIANLLCRIVIVSGFFKMKQLTIGRRT